MFDVYFDLVCNLKGKLYSQDSARQKVNQDLKHTADRLRELAQDEESLLDASMCYYISGYYVHAQSLAKSAKKKDLQFIQTWVFLFLAKDFKNLSEETSNVLKDAKYQDDFIQGEIDSKGLSTSEVIERIVTAKIAECLLDIITFIENGDNTENNHASQILLACQNLLFQAEEWKLWWRLEFLKFVIEEFTENSLWNLLHPMQSDAFSSDTVAKYIVANYKSESIIELWKTQVECLPKINDVERCSFCISVPTSAGKTKVGELAVLRFLLDFGGQQDKKCVYIAPLKTLCLEVEKSFRSVFSQIPSGLVSSFYGYHEVDVFDDYAIKQARILIVTPEKLDGMLRQYPDLASQIKLVIADEGHIIGEANVRGYKYRFLLERLICALNKKSSLETIKPRIILVSGVLPHMEEFSDFISGSRQNVVKIDWKPVEEPRIGSWIWDGKEFTSTDDQLPVPLPFQSSICQEDNKFEEQVVLTAIQCAMTSSTMVFSASKKVLQGKKLLEFLQCLVANAPLFPIRDSLPSNIQKYPMHYALLEKGIAIHHSDVPSEVKREVEKRINNGNVRLLFASPTLAQGVNIPFDVVLAYRLHHNNYPYTPITDPVFWNVVGRVGRPVSQKRRTASTVEPPRLLFLLNKSSSATYDDANDCRTSIEIQKNGRNYRVASPFLKFLSTIKAKTTLSPQEVINELAEKKNLQDIVGSSVSSLKLGEMTLEQYLIMLDEQLFALLHESFSDVEIVSDWLQSSAKSLVDLFVKASDLTSEDFQYIKDAVVARLAFIAKNSSAVKRRQDYLLGLPYVDCEEIKSHKDELLSWYRGCVDLFAGNRTQGIGNLVKLMNFVASLSICKRKQISKTSKNAEKKNAAQTKLFENWLNGFSEDELEKGLKPLSSVEFQRYKEKILDRIPWGVSAIGRYLTGLMKEDEDALSQDLEYLPALVKCGVNSKTACHLVRLGVPRTMAVRINDAYLEKIQAVEFDEGILVFENDFYESIKSLNGLTDEELSNLDIDKELMLKISEIRARYKRETIGVSLEHEFPPYEFEEINSDEIIDF
jgi:superfamily II DNA/RNA helicase